MRKLVQEGSKKWKHPISISLGAATFAKHGENSDELVAKAEKALNQAKRMGKNRLVEADPVSI
jgi:GGDEF domain-containing protein